MKTLTLTQDDLLHLQLAARMSEPRTITLTVTEDELSRLQLGLFALAEHLQPSPHQADQDMLARVDALTRKLCQATEEESNS